MSTTTLAAANEDGVLCAVSRFQNSWGSAPFVWDSVATRYSIGADPNTGKWGIFDRPSIFDWEKVWKYHTDGGELTAWEKNTLESTYDNTVVRREDMLTVAESFRRFTRWHLEGSRVCSLGEQADAIEKAYADGAKYIAWYQTSTSECWWHIYDPETDESVDYNVDTGDKHRFATISALGDDTGERPTL